MIRFFRRAPAPQPAASPPSPPAPPAEESLTDRREFLLRLARTSAFVAPAIYSVSLGALPAAGVSSPRDKVCEWNTRPKKCEPAAAPAASPSEGSDPYTPSWGDRPTRPPMDPGIDREIRPTRPELPRPQRPRPTIPGDPPSFE